MMNPRTRRSFAAAAASLAAVAACARGPAPDAGTVSRIVSLSPSLSRAVADLGAADRLAGVTSFDGFRGRVAVVGTIVRPNCELILSIDPDVVICSEEDGAVQIADRLSGAGVRVHRFGKNRDFGDIIANYLALGKLLGREGVAGEKARGYGAARAAARSARPPGRRPRVAFLVSVSPLVAAAASSYIGGIIGDAGGVCAFGPGRAGPYPIVSLESLVAAEPDLVLAMTGEWDAVAACRARLAGFPRLAASVHGVDPGSIAYYTPADYVRSVQAVRAILDRRRPNNH